LFIVRIGTFKANSGGQARQHVRLRPVRDGIATTRHAGLPMSRRSNMLWATNRERRFMAKPLRIGVVYDLRNPPESGMPTPDLYAAALEQVTWLDSLGLDLVWFTEHHFIDDGYLPS